MTDVPLRDYFDRILSEQAEAHRVQLASAQKALDSAAETLEARLEMMNEFRAQITEERALYVRRDQLDLVVDRIGKLEEQHANVSGRFWMLGIGLTIGLSVLTALLTIALRHIGQ